MVNDDSRSRERRLACFIAMATAHTAACGVHASWKQGTIGDVPAAHAPGLQAPQCQSSGTG